jgi:hypothetical protein
MPGKASSAIPEEFSTKVQRGINSWKQFWREEEKVQIEISAINHRKQPKEYLLPIEGSINKRLRSFKEKVN